MELYIYLLVGLLAGLIMGYLLILSKSKDIQKKLDLSHHQMNEIQTQMAVLESQKQQLGQSNEQLRDELIKERHLSMEITRQKEFNARQLAVAKSEIESLSKQLETYQKDVIKMEERFENLANKIFEKKTSILKTQNKDNLKDVLDPLKERIFNFEKRVNEIHKETVHRQGELGQELKQLQQLNQQVSQEAQNLTKALKGDKKIQGNWGELVLENVLKKSGLEKGREYVVQESLVSGEGKRYQPDVIVNMPEDTKMIIDSKVSLVAYEKMINADTEEEQRQHLHNHIAAIKVHVKSLGEKNYHELVDNGPDFVLMFIPIETAFAVATSEDPKLYNDALDMNIVIVTPSTLLATLKTIDSRWKNEKQHKNALLIASEAGKMYDKFEALLADLRGLGDRLNTTKKSYDAAMNKLVDGKGNLIRRAEQLKKLGAKANKQIQKDWLSKAEPEEQLPAAEE